MALLESEIVDRIADVPNLGLKDWLRTWQGRQLEAGCWALVCWCLAWGCGWPAGAKPSASRSTVGFLGQVAWSWPASALPGRTLPTNASKPPSAWW